MPTPPRVLVQETPQLRQETRGDTYRLVKAFARSRLHKAPPPGVAPAALWRMLAAPAQHSPRRSGVWGTKIWSWCRFTLDRTYCCTLAEPLASHRRILAVQKQNGKPGVRGSRVTHMLDVVRQKYDQRVFPGRRRMSALRSKRLCLRDWRRTYTTDFSDATSAFASVFRSAPCSVLDPASVWNQQLLLFQRLKGVAFTLQSTE